MTCKRIEVEIETDDDGERFQLKPALDPYCARDVTLVVGSRKFYVNKQSLAVHSTYFNALFFGGYKESKQSEIEIKDVDPKDFGDLLDIFHGFEHAPLMDKVILFAKVEVGETFLQLAERFDLKIVSDRAESFLLRKWWRSKHECLRLADQYKLELLKKKAISMYQKNEDVEELWNSTDYEKISRQTLQVLWKKSLKFDS
ncbi:hypothetical protein PFISCL1PPCAC_12303 [Pristionchus fissidentatus]|uniref:BTB domain-containing protein n=1 Tax=Pristionchus fissidentatus TaxID=1538716 RepID=A0AAV5VR11_9BILA|nr:hypothetical protein PFISCL1PPCAC_12303 [Pristionchus fissidentatus]